MKATKTYLEFLKRKTVCKNLVTNAPKEIPMENKVIYTTEISEANDIDDEKFTWALVDEGLSLYHAEEASREITWNKLSPKYYYFRVKGENKKIEIPYN